MRAAAILALLFAGLISWTPRPESDAQPIYKQSGLDVRTPWTTSKMVGSPEPPPPYRTVRAFPKLKFDEPLDFTYGPGSKRLWIAERWGKIYSFPNDQNADKADLAIHLQGIDAKGEATRQHIYGFAFHPKFKDNGFLFVTYIADGSKETPTGTRVSRFTAKGEPPTIDRASERVILEWPNAGHNGGCLKFGRDGMLYIATGDGSGIADGLIIGQDLGSIHAKLLRIDVDKPAPQKGYGIPKDNPFVDTAGARPEVWAYGLRQMWRFSFERDGQGRKEDVVNRIYGGDVGQDLWEMVYTIQKGGNYGWSVMEGAHPFRPERKKGPTPILPPVVEHAHTDFRSITGGYVYHGSRLPELKLQYIYGDFDTGRIWAFLPGYSAVTDKDGKTHEKVQPHEHRELARTTYRIVTFGEDADAELYFVDFMGGGLHQLAKAEAKPQTAFPRKLSETGLFTSTAKHQVAPGVISYSVNAELWGDHAHKERFLAVPGVAQIGFDEITYPQSPPLAPAGWHFPDGTVLVKTFSMDMERGNPQSRKRLETRLLHFQQFPGSNDIGDQYWRGYTYVWNDKQTDAELLDEKGGDVHLKIKVGDKLVEQKYHFPSRAECTLCHTMAAKYVLGVNTLQMNGTHQYPGAVLSNQLATLDAIDMFKKKLPATADKLPKLAKYTDDSQPIEVRARSYLHANCSHCHTKWGGGNADFKLLATLPLKDLGIINVRPGHGDFGLKDAKLVVPGHPEQSLLPHRMQMTGLGRMPHVGSNVVDDLGVRLVRDWITKMK